MAMLFRHVFGGLRLNTVSPDWKERPRRKIVRLQQLDKLHAHAGGRGGDPCSNMQTCVTQTVAGGDRAASQSALLVERTRKALLKTQRR